MTADDIPAIEVTGLACGYDGVALLEDMNFSVGRGEIFFVIGGSGCGKSTLLRHMIGLLTPMEGSVKYFGENFTGADVGKQRDFLQNFGVLYQGGALWSSLTLRENIALPLSEYTTLNEGERDEIVGLKLAQVGLAGFENHYPAELSGGMKKRAGLARALALDPAVVFFDEPSAGLDPITSRRLDELIVDISSKLGTTCVIVSHELDSIFSIGNRIILLDKQARGIIAEGDPRKLAAESSDPRVVEFLKRGTRPSQKQSLNPPA